MNWKLDPQSKPKKYQIAGDGHYVNGDYENCVVCYKQAAEFYLATGQFLKAKDCYAILASLFAEKDRKLDITLRHSVADAIFKEALKFESQERLVEAETLFRCVLDLKDDRLINIALWYLGRVLAEAGKFLDAVDVMDQYYSKVKRMEMEKNKKEFPSSRLDATRCGIPAILFIAQIKSASEYITAILKKTFQISAYYNLSIETFPNDYLIPSALCPIAEGGNIARLHADANDHNLSLLERLGINKLMIHVRDPRQATISWLHYVIKRSDDYINTARLLYTPPIPKNFLSMSFNEKLEWAIEFYYPGVISWINGWMELEKENHQNFQLKYTTFEEFANNPASFLQNMALFFGICHDQIPETVLSYSKETTSNFRKGLTDEWKTVYTSKQLDYMWSLMPKFMATRFNWKEH